ncbi:hypothetical protein F4813DRAFT_397407 [Daldinia decipiens]|uniref:uncharacterized protein n=1 Tax=Daldinia decipiens TaxID=326647 RepID=UPI0020C45BEE|nr:uncharacterized protein F4813DRAFT_397407 [Daldinia decipiens]KAI1656524.1 hypothetical protein F4813DRAFT_397407 [Daldinia decipiens]
MAKKRAFSSEEGDRAGHKRIRTRTKSAPDASDDKINKAINMALSKASVGKKYTWMNRETGTLQKPEPPVYKTKGKEEEKGLADCPGSPESYTTAYTTAPPTVANDGPIQPSIENASGDAPEDFDEELAEMEKALADDEESDEIVAAMEKELAEDQMLKSRSGSGSSESPIVISSREPSPVNIPSKEDTPTKNITDSKKPALPTPPKTDNEEKPEQQKQKKPAKKPVQKKPKQKPVVQEPEEDPAVAEAQEREELFAMLDYIYQFAY